VEAELRHGGTGRLPVQLVDDLLQVVAEQRLQRPANRHRTSFAVDRVGQREPHHHVDGPRVNAPVQERLGHRLLRQVPAFGTDPFLAEPVFVARGAGIHPWSGRVVVHQWFRGPPEDQADSHSRGEEHREPGVEAELGLFVIFAQGDVAEPADTHPDGKDHEERDDHHVVPAEALDDVVLDCLQELSYPVGHAHGQHAHQSDDDERGEEHPRRHPP
jgi:hypothetical protein